MWFFWVQWFKIDRKNKLDDLDDISLEELSICDGLKSEKIYLAMKGYVFDVANSGKKCDKGKGNLKKEKKKKIFRKKQ